MINKSNQFTDVFKLRTLYIEVPLGDNFEMAKWATG